MIDLIEMIDGRHFAEMIASAAAAIEASRQAVNELNVFPVPDGDTGTNMSLTMGAAAAEVRKDPSDAVGTVADTLAQGLLRGARGNSGVILSLLFRGFARRIKEHDAITGIHLAEALQDGVDAAYRVVMKPAEGTILTVSSRAAHRAAVAALEDTSFEYVLAEALDTAMTALDETVHQNPVLAKAGVVDAGGKGFCIILDGMLCALRGQPFTPVEITEGVLRDRADFSEYSNEDIRFPYCTEFIILRENQNDATRLQACLGSIGDSLVVVDDEKIIKVHVHTSNPGSALEEALKYGQLTSIKIENMREQHTQQVSFQEEAPGRKIVPSSRDFGFVTVCAGSGMSRVFHDLGTDAIIEGGQTMNPSTDDILAGVDKTPSETVFILPNNKNIIMAADQCIPLSEKRVIVIPSRSIPQGIAAMLAFDPAADVEQNRDNMISAMTNVSTAQVTYAARESEFDGKTIREGDYLALLDGHLHSSDSNEKTLLQSLATAIGGKSPAYITIFYGQDTDEEMGEAVRALFATVCPMAEISLLDGGQPVYRFVISAE